MFYMFQSILTTYGCFNRTNKLLTDSNPALSAFHAMTGIPKKPAIWRKYWEAAVLLPNSSVLVKYNIATLPFCTCWQSISVMSEKEIYAVWKRKTFTFKNNKMHKRKAKVILCKQSAGDTKRRQAHPS